MLFRTILNIAVVAVAVVASMWVAQHPGEAQINWLGYTHTLPIWVVLAGIAVFMLAFHLCIVIPYRLLRGLFSVPAKISEAKTKKAEEKERVKEAVEQAIEQHEEQVEADTSEMDEELPILLLRGYVSLLCAGDVFAARDYMETAKKADPDVLYTQLLEGLVCKEAREFDAYRDVLKKVAESDDCPEEVELAALRGLARDAMILDESDIALGIVNRAAEKSPDVEWVLRYRFQLQVKQKKWADALATLERGHDKGLSSEEEYNRLRSTVLVEQANEAKMSGDLDTAVKHAAAAANADRSLAPAAVLAAELYGEKNLSKKAVNLLTGSWRARPVPAVMDAYLALWSNENEFVKVQRTEQLAMANSGHPENHLATAERALDAKLWGQARKELDSFMSKMPTNRRAARLMARFEEGGNRDSKAAAQWLRDVESAEPDGRWACTKCGAQPQEWETTCSSCGTFASVDWLTPGFTVEEEIARAEEAKQKAKEERKKR